MLRAGLWRQRSPSMATKSKLRTVALRVCCVVCLTGGLCHAQDLTPRAYVITPVRSNAIVLGYAFITGSVLFNSSLPITDASGRINLPNISYYHSLDLLGHSANITATLPYAVGNFRGENALNGNVGTLYRSGLGDSIYRFAVNLKGGSAMPVQEFLKWRQKTIIGASLKMIAPTGQYNPSVLVNIGTNRWSFKPELGYSHKRGKWLFDTYGGAWFYTPNHEFFSHNKYFSGTNTQSQRPIGSFEGHLSYNVTPRFWFSLDGNYWFGGRTTVNDVLNIKSYQSNSRIGVTGAFPVSKYQTLKVSYSGGTYVRYGGNYQQLSVAWQYSWLGRPK